MGDADDSDRQGGEKGGGSAEVHDPLPAVTGNTTEKGGPVKGEGRVVAVTRWALATMG